MTKIIAMLLTSVAVSLTMSAETATISVTTPAGRTVSVTALTPEILKVVNTVPGETEAVSRASVLDNSPLPASAVVISGNTMTTATGLTASISPQGVLTINGGNGRVLTDSGQRTLSDGQRSLSLTIPSGGSLYGAGERGHRLNLRGDTLVMYNRQNYGYTGSDPRISQMNITMPLLLSSEGYAIVFDDYAAAKLVADNPLQYITEGRAPVSYYYVNSTGSLADLTRNLTALTGRQELPPVWAMGYITSKYGYKDENDAISAVDSLKASGYPLDGIVLDLYWYGKEQDMGRLAWDKKQWPDPSWMMDYFKQKGVNLVAISQPYVLTNGRGVTNYNQLAPKGMLVKDQSTGKPLDVKIWVGEGGMFDVSNPTTREWLANRYDTLTRTGITGWWGDLGEPEVHPENGLHANGLTTRQYHNQYGNDWSEIIYDMFKAKYPDTRLLTMMRGGTTGLQRYDVFPWSTDVSRSWGGLEPQIRIMLNSGLSGLGYMGHDVGGFAVDEKAPYDPELYVRWLQLGLFSPMLRTHAQQYAEPYNYPDQKSIILPLIKERYQWLPYNYTLAWENATNGWPLVRPLDFHADKPQGKYDGISDQFLWGRDVLVAPVMVKGATSRTVVFPEGDNWIDMKNPLTVHNGGAIATVSAPLDVLPVYVRAGAFIPRAMYPMKSTRNYRPNNYTIEYYPQEGLNSTGYLFEDDMKTPSTLSFNDGRVITFSAEDLEKDIMVTLSAEGSYPGAATNKTMTFQFRGLKKEPRWIEVDGKNSRMTWDKTTGTASVSFVWNLTRSAIVQLKKK
ncbi:MAG: hypothetical protein J6C44_10435 [Muribaculaceae bacterium]|nr:hypothetical protein [Muribaculaceae bacterium]